MKRINYPASRKPPTFKDGWVSANKGKPKPPIDRTCKYCDGHYIGFNGTRYCSDLCRFKASVEPQPDGCWHWAGYKPKTGSRVGYGEFYTKDDKRILAHRASYMLIKGEDPGEQCVLHKCDNPSCVNPDHLFLGDRTENSADRQRKERQARGQTHGFSKLTDDDVRAIRQDDRTNRALAKIYGVFETTISEARRGKTWKHVK
jgi:hypothetical protein